MAENTRVQCLVVTHKPFPYEVPEGYSKMQVGCAVSGQHWDGYLHDDVGENISEKNGCYCELTALYWLWKNSDADIKGLCHYRRFFMADKIWEKEYYAAAFPGEDLHKHCVTSSQIRKIMDNKDAIVLLPYPPFTRTAREDLLKYCYQKDVDILSGVIAEFYPEYMEAYKWAMESRNLSYCNMMIAKRNVFDGYCQWIFDVLAKCETRCDIRDYDTQHKRIYGYLSEVLMNVYLAHNRLRCAYSVLLVPEEDGGGGPVSLKGRILWGIKSWIIRTGNFSVLERYYKQFRPERYEYASRMKPFFDSIP